MKHSELLFDSVNLAVTMGLFKPSKIHKKKNSRGDAVKRGATNDSGGFTNLPAHKIYYCGKVHNECQCGRCNGTCGPRNGCPCESCFQLLLSKKEETKYRLNSRGIISKRGGNDGHGGSTPFLPSELWYCGGKREEPCKCSRCNDDLESGGGVCGPSSGCPCSACFEILLDENIARIRVNIENENDQIVMRKGRQKHANPKKNRVCNGLLDASELWYCEQIGSSGEKCSEDTENGRPCENCLQVLIDEGKVKITTDDKLLRRGVGKLDLNEGSSSHSASSTCTYGFDPEKLWYCGQKVNKHQCSSCGARCGPTSGCPCSACLKISIPESAEGNSYSEDADKLNCKICFEKKIESVILPCGHPSACWECAEKLKSCPICRGDIRNLVRIYLPC